MGVELQIHALQNEGLYPAMTPPRVYKDKQYESSNAMVMLVPEGSIMLTIVSENGSIFIQHKHEQEVKWHMASALMQNFSLPPDIIFHVLLYIDKFNHVVLGMYDMSRVNGVSTKEKTCLQRHIELRKLVGEQTIHVREESIHKFHMRFLWVGYEKDCISSLKKRENIIGLNFKVKCIAKLPENLTNDEFARMLPPLKIPVY